MSRRSKAKKEDLENFTGGFSRIPHAVMDCNAFIGATDKAKSLLFALMRQINGKNNGRLQLTDRWLAKQGWRSKSKNKTATAELIKRGLIVQTKQGGKNIGCNWYAVTWLPINNFVGLDMSAKAYRQGLWADCKLPPTERRKPPVKKQATTRLPKEKKQKFSPGYRGSTTPTTGAASLITTPTTGVKKTNSAHSTTPTTGHNVSIPLPT